MTAVDSLAPSSTQFGVLQSFSGLVLRWCLSLDLLFGHAVDSSWRSAAVNPSSLGQQGCPTPQWTISSIRPCSCCNTSNKYTTSSSYNDNNLPTL